jgi:excisionase family DNA binding protein
MSFDHNSSPSAHIRYRTGTATPVCSRPGAHPSAVLSRPSASSQTSLTQTRPALRDSLGPAPLPGSAGTRTRAKDGQDQMSSPLAQHQPTLNSEPRRPLIGEFRQGELLKTSQAAAFLAVNERTLRDYLRSGLLASQRLPGGHYRIPIEALEQFLRANEPRARPQTAPVPEQHQPSADSEGTASPPLARRTRLGHELPRDYDVSIETLRAIRARLVP